MVEEPWIHNTLSVLEESRRCDKEEKSEKESPTTTPAGSLRYHTHHVRHPSHQGCAPATKAEDMTRLNKFGDSDLEIFGNFRRRAAGKIHTILDYDFQNNGSSTFLASFTVFGCFVVIPVKAIMHY
jgi:hypothetical protein